MTTIITLMFALALILIGNLFILSVLIYKLATLEGIYLSKIAIPYKWAIAISALMTVIIVLLFPFITVTLVLL